MNNSASREILIHGHMNQRVGHALIMTMNVCVLAQKTAVPSGPVLVHVVVAAFQQADSCWTYLLLNVA